MVPRIPPPPPVVADVSIATASSQAAASATASADLGYLSGLAGLPDEKLPVDLPAITVIGHRTHPDARSGSKLAPNTAAELMALPPPPPERATDDFLSRMRLSTPQPPTAAIDLEPRGDRQPFTQIWGELGGMPAPGLARYDLGLSHGREIGPALSLTDLRAYASQLDQWSILKASERLSWGATSWANFSYRRDQETPGVESALQEGGGADARWTENQLAFKLGAHLGHVQVWPIEAQASNSVPLVASTDETWMYDLAGAATYTPALGWAGHSPDVRLLLGDQGTTETGLSGWSAPRVELGARDTWIVQPAWGLTYGLAATTMGQADYLDPAVKVDFRPGGHASEGAQGLVSESPTDLWVSASTRTDLPDFARLYLDRLQVAGNGDLRPERTQPEVALGASERFSDKLYGDASLTFGNVLDFIYLAQTPQGLWQPRNFASWQGVYDVRAGAQYLWTDGNIWHFDLDVQQAAALGQTLESIGATHQSRWLDGKLTLSLGTSLQYVQLGPSQTFGPGNGLAWLANWQVGYMIAPNWQLYASGDDWHVVTAEEPGPGYFATPALASGGLKVSF